MTIEINLNSLLIFLGSIWLFLIMFLSQSTAIFFVKWRERVRRQAMVEDFLDHMTQKVQTEEEFNEIVKRMRKDFGDGAGI